MSLTNYGENAVLGLVRGAATFWLALFCEVPGEEGTGAEISGGGYVRQRVSFGEASGGALENAEAIEFPTASSDWGTAAGWAIFDAETGGNMWWAGAVDVPKPLYAGDIYRVDAGGLSLRME
jgi:hypothetical protein